MIFSWVLLSISPPSLRWRPVTSPPPFNVSLPAAAAGDGYAQTPSRRYVSKCQAMTSEACCVPYWLVATLNLTTLLRDLRYWG
jgi:hypothetical protein